MKEKRLNNPPELPKTNKKETKFVYNFKEYLTEPFDKEKAYLIYSSDLKLVKNNFAFLEKVVNDTENNITICSEDYNLLKFVSDNINSNKALYFRLMDDFTNKDRSYIDSKSFGVNNFVIPHSYLLWNPRLKDQQSIAPYNIIYDNYKTTESSNSYYDINIGDLKKIKELVYNLAYKYNDYSDIEKIIIISNYLQDRVQFVDVDNISEAVDGVYKTDSKEYPVDNRTVGSAESVLLNNYGVCNGIAHATTLLLNNPEMNVNVRSVYGSGHAWNVINMDNKNYYIDNTWSITRNNNRYDESLKAKKFTSEYLLFGEDKALDIGHHIPYYYCPKVEKDSIDIDSNVKKLSKVISFDNYRKPVFESRKIK